MKSILIVEDDLATLRVLTNRLRREGFTVLKAADGIEGLNLAFTQKPDLILLDIIMPRMDGISMLKKLRQNQWGKKVPVIVLTNLSYAATESETLRRGVYNYLVKSDWGINDVVKKIKDTIA